MTISVLQTFPKRGRFFGKDIDPFTGSKPQKETLMSSCNTNNQQDNTKNSGSLPGDLAREVELVAVNQLVPYGGNARTHSKKQVRQIAESIKQFGFTNPVLIDNRNGIIAGHGRVEAAKLLGLNGIPALRLSHLSEAERRAYIIADNKLAQKAGWDREILAIELQGLIDLDFDVELTGFEMDEIDILLDDVDEARREPRGRKMKARSPCRGRVSVRQVTCGSWGTIASCAVMRLTRVSTSQSDVGKRTQEKSPLWRRAANHLRRSKKSGPDRQSLLIEND